MGDRAGVGGQAGRSGDGSLKRVFSKSGLEKVSSESGLRLYRAAPGSIHLRSNLARLACMFLICWFFWGCTSPAAPAPSAASLLQGIPQANPAKYPDLRQTKVWLNPYIVIRADRVGLLTGVAASEEQHIKPEEVLDVLAHLPPAAWPYGRAVAILVSEEPGSSDADKIELRRKRGLVAGELEGAHVAIQWIPAAGSGPS
jgi:hypothetical protein